MSSVALEVTWVIFTLTAIPASWLVLIPFSVATGHWWGQILYGVIVTVMESVFAIGLIYNILRMHTTRSFCLAQAIIPSIGSYILSGICICLAVSTYSTVFNLKRGPLSHRRNPLEWKPIYLLFIVLWPLLATTAFVVTFLERGVTFESLSHFPCEVIHPLWPRLLGYAGAPFLASVPALVLSAITAYRITTVSRMRKSPSNRQEQVARLPPIRVPVVERRRSVPYAGRMERERCGQSLTVPASDSHEKQSDRSSVLSIPHSLSDSAWLPSPPTVHDVAVSDASHVLPGSCSALQHSPSHQRASSPSPSPLVRDGAYSPPSPITFAPVNQTPQASRRPSFDPNSLHYYDELNPIPVSPFDYDDEESSTTPNTEQELVIHRVHRWSQLPRTADSSGDKFEATAYGAWPPMLKGLTRARSGSLLPSPELIGAFRRILFFQIAFSCIVILAGLTTWIDLASNREVPSSFGTQHVAIVLVGWGPFAVFGAFRLQAIILLYGAVYLGAFVGANRLAIALASSTRRRLRGGKHEGHHIRSHGAVSLHQD